MCVCVLCAAALIVFVMPPLFYLKIEKANRRNEVVATQGFCSRAMYVVSRGGRGLRNRLRCLTCMYLRFVLQAPHHRVGGAYHGRSPYPYLPDGADPDPSGLLLQLYVVWGFGIERGCLCTPARVQLIGMPNQNATALGLYRRPLKAPRTHSPPTTRPRDATSIRGDGAPVGLPASSRASHVCLRSCRSPC